ncbi:MAG: peptidoglycan bridge formation glycyltransferase FemA/FemB family protein [Candidatus Yanofskybacteria bacterium]|nr:peptidoglycan bridge formation glycyltransferase FemA/FemB family protein [Candidatus Yanofskybacteria bacterium]
MSFLQSKDWLEFQKFLGRSVFEYDKEGIKAGIIKLPEPFKKSYLYIAHGPEMDFNSMAGGLKNPVSNFTAWLKDLAEKEKSIFIKAEPLADNIAQVLAEHKFKKSKKEIQPPKTVILDLSKSEDDLLNAMHHKTRYNVKVAEKNGIVVKESDDLESFWKLIKKTSKRDKFSSHSKDYYEKLLKFFNDGKEITSGLNLAYYKDQPVAGLILMTHKDTAYYLHGASDYDYRQYMAPYKLHWEVIKKLQWASLQKSAKMPIVGYDLWGIDSKKWPGVTRFKFGWGGKVVEYPGSFDLPISKFWFLAYKVARRLEP